MIRRLLGALLVLAAGAAALQAQQPGLDRVDEQLREHRYEEARSGIERWWQTAGDTARGDVRAHGLFLRAVLTSNLEAAERDLLRIAVEHPQSAYAGRALLRLAHLRRAGADTAGARVFLERLVQDHPNSPERAPALAMLGGARAPPSPPARAAAAPVPSGPPARAAAAPARQRPAPEYPPGAEFTVQVGAFATIAEAEALRDRLRAAGFDAFLARLGGRSQTLVRVGSFRDRAGADALMRRLRAAGHPAQVVAIGQP
jgi:hypothetical protein